MRPAALPLVGLIRLYQLVVSPLLPAGTCKFHPSCSQYAVEALRRYGLARGVALAVRRLGRCHPWSDGGVDYPSWPPATRRRAASPQPLPRADARRPRG